MILHIYLQFLKKLRMKEQSLFQKVFRIFKGSYWLSSKFCLLFLTVLLREDFSLKLNF